MDIEVVNTALVLLKIIVLILSFPLCLSSSLISALLALSCVPRSFLCSSFFVEFLAFSRPSSIVLESQRPLCRLTRLDLARGVE